MLDSSLRERYVLHTECVKFSISETEEHLMLLTFERFQEDGFLVKMHDMKFAASEELFLVKKSNGQYARLTPVRWDRGPHFKREGARRAKKPHL